MSVSKIIQNNNGVAPQQVEGSIHFDRLNDFNLSYDHATSFDFSKVVPVGYDRTVPKDVFDLSASVNVIGNSTPNPILSNIRQIVDIYKVPFQAIYKDWEDVIGVYQSKGDNVPVDARAYFNPTILWQSLYPAEDGFSKFTNLNLMTFARYILALSSVYGRDSILNNFNIHISRGLYATDPETEVDSVAPSSFFYSILSKIYDYMRDNQFNITFVFGDTSTEYGFAPDSNNIISSFSQFVELILSSSSASSNAYINDDLPDEFYNTLASAFNSLVWYGYADVVNIEPIIGYQMILADKFSNAKVDNVYTSRMYSDGLRQIVYESGLPMLQDASFSINGKRYYYEPYSNYVFERVTSSLLAIVSEPLFVNKCNYLLSIFGFGRPLRYGDYFTASRLEPLAPGSTRVTIQGDSIDAVDLNKKEWLYSFLYNLHVATSEFRDYIKGIYGSKIEPSRSDIVRLVRKEKYLGKESVENTGADQFEYVGSGKLPMSSILRGGASDTSLVYHSPESCLLITLVWHDAKIFRSNTVAKDSRIRSVLDEYIPELEFTGDQMILGSELDGSKNYSNIFGWNQHFAEYKMKTSFVSGAFLDDYANGMLLTDSGYTSNNGPLELSSTFIRQSIMDYERFFGSARFGLQSVHAYAVVNFNTNAKRPMYINPQPMR